MTLRLRAKLALIVTDWAHAFARQAAAVIDRTPASALRVEGGAPGCRAPIVLLPGIWEPWRFLLPLGRFLAGAGHPVHVVEGLGWNGRELDASAEIVATYLAEHHLRGVFLVAHSKGGLIGKRVMVDADAGPRVRGMIALCSPFGGSSLSLPLLRRSPLGLFAPSGLAIAALASEREVNGRVVSLASAWDEMIPEGSTLPGGRNLALDLAGHFRPLADAGVHELVHRQLHELIESEPPMELTAIAAVGRNGAIGIRGDVPWHIPEDWRRFKAVTMGGSLIMGRKTFELIGAPLPGRTSIVVSRSPREPAAASPVTAEPNQTRVIWVNSLDEAIAAADPSRPIWVAGGAEIYRLAWDRLTGLDICEVDQEPEADTFFPAITDEEWVETSRDQREGYAFVRYQRRES
ncbi:MAG: dihydrofolate reductase [Micropruina sp.]